jgi:peptidoglycan/LPS O-acetylase OafA/YrhL
MPVLFAIMIAVFKAEAGALSRLLKAEAFQVLGRLSFSIYLLHGLVLYVFAEVATLTESKMNVTLWQTLPHGGRMVPTVVLDHPVFGLAALAQYLGIVVALAFLTHRFIEAPARSIFDDWRRRIGGPPALPWIFTRQIAKGRLNTKSL